MSLRLPLPSALLAAVLAGCASGGSRVDVPAPRAAAEEEIVFVAPASPGQPYFEFQVEKPAAAVRRGSCVPAYPESLRETRTTGEVIGQFVVDTTGVPELRTFKAIRSSHDAFATAVLAALPCMRFRPAVHQGRRVRQVVQQPFVFDLMR